MNPGDKVKVRFNGITFTGTYKCFRRGKHIVTLVGIKGEVSVNQVYPVENAAS